MSSSRRYASRRRASEPTPSQSHGDRSRPDRSPSIVLIHPTAAPGGTRGDGDGRASAAALRSSSVDARSPGVRSLGEHRVGANLEKVFRKLAGSARADFLIRLEETLIEIKRPRETRSAKDVADELIIDIERYRQIPQTNRLIRFVS